MRWSFGVSVDLLAGFEGVFPLLFSLWVQGQGMMDNDGMTRKGKGKSKALFWYLLLVACPFPRVWVG